MPRREKHAEGYLRTRTRWFLGGAIVMTIALFALDYLCFMQATIAFSGSADSLESFQRVLMDGSAKAFVLMLSFALFAFFFVMQDYQMAFATLLEKMMVSHRNIEGQSEDRVLLTAANIDDLTFLESSIESMLQENVTYKNRLERQKDLMQENFVIRLLKGWTRDGDSAYEAGVQYGINLHVKSLQTVVFGVDEADMDELPSDGDVAKCYQVVRNLLAQMCLDEFAPMAVEVDGILAFLVASCDDDADALRKAPRDLLRIVKLCRQVVADDTGIALRAGIGSAVADLAAVGKSFSEAVDLLQYAKITGDREPISVYRTPAADAAEQSSDYQWFTEEMRFMTCIRTGEYGKARDIFSGMIGSDYVLKAGSAREADYRMRDLTMLVANALGEIRQSVDAAFFSEIDVQDQLDVCESLRELNSVADGVFDKLDIYITSMRSRSPSDKISEIINYLANNYSDSNLSVGSIANLFGMNPSYLSRTFKKRTGAGLADYLTKLRVQEAKRLMRDSKVTVKDAADAVGFNNVTTMNRAFKKLEGTTAGKVRRLGPEADE